MTVHPEVLIQLRNEQVVDVEGFSVPEDNTLLSVNGKDIKGPPESLKTVACRKRYDVEPGRPYCLLRFKIRKVEKYRKRESLPYASRDSYQA
jgi:hypothetical protein